MTKQNNTPFRYILITMLLIFSGISLIDCSNVKKQYEEILHKKGFNEMEKRLKPEIIQVNNTIEGLLALNIKNIAGTVNGKGEFALLKLEDNKNITINVISPGFPPHLGDKYYSDDEHNMMWMIGGRGFYALDIETKITRHITVSYGLNDGILNSFLADPERKLFYIEVAQYSLNPTLHYILYDFIQDKIIFESPNANGLRFPFYNNTFLFCEFLKIKGKQIYKWQITDLFGKQLETNNLVDKMSELQISVWDRSKTRHLGKRMMLGTLELNNILTYYSISWKEDINEYSIEPLTFQIPKDTIVDSGFVFSGDGNWVSTTGEKKTGMVKVPELLIYNVNKKYPQGLSPPIYCGYTKELNPGVFINHSTFGPLYIEQDTDFPNKLFIYSLTDGLKLLSGID